MFRKWIPAYVFALLIAGPLVALAAIQRSNIYTMPSSGNTTYHAVTVGASSAAALAAGKANVYLMLVNPNVPGGNTVTCAFGVDAVANAAGTITVAPGQSYTWESSLTPTDAVNCIASGSTAFTVGYQ